MLQKSLQYWVQYPAVWKTFKKQADIHLIRYYITTILKQNHVSCLRPVEKKQYLLITTAIILHFHDWISTLAALDKGKANITILV